MRKSIKKPQSVGIISRKDAYLGQDAETNMLEKSQLMKMKNVQLMLTKLEWVEGDYDSKIWKYSTAMQGD